MLRVWISLLPIAWTACSLCGAQENPSPDPPILQLKVVRFAPFSATATTESAQVLPDGNRIVRKTTAALARDSEGRTRREQTVSGGSVIFIQDPVSKAAYALEPATHVARKIAISNSDASQPAATGVPTTSVRSEALGSQFLEGVSVQGTRLTRTLSPNEAGNERPIEIVTEAWFSDELQTVIMSRTLDPRAGETVYRLTDLRRNEPLRSSFEVPSEYTVRETPIDIGVSAAKSRQ